MPRNHKSMRKKRKRIKALKSWNGHWQQTTKPEIDAFKTGFNMGWDSRKIYDADLSPYDGEWVAIVECTVVGHNADLKVLIDEMQDSKQWPLYIRVHSGMIA